MELLLEEVEMSRPPRYTAAIIFCSLSLDPLHPGPPDRPDHQDPTLREESLRDVFPDDLLLPAVLDALRCRVHDGGFWQEEHGVSDGGRHPLILRQVQHSLQPPHLCLHE